MAAGVEEKKGRSLAVLGFQSLKRIKGIVGMEHKAVALSVERDADGNDEEKAEQQDPLLEGGLDEGSDKPQTFQDKKDLQDRIEKCELCDKKDLEEKADEEEVKNKEFPDREFFS